MKMTQSLITMIGCTIKQFNQILEEMPSPREIKLATDPKLAYGYAMATHRRFPAGEKAIATSAKYSWYYALNIIKGPFPAGEKVIATSAMFAYNYAAKVIKGRFSTGEDIIATNFWYAILYASDVIKGRWPKGEKTIVTEPYYWELYKRKLSIK